MAKLTKLPAPVYWSRWDVDGLGVVERRGGFAPWRAVTADGWTVGLYYRTRAEAVAALRLSTNTPRKAER